MAGVPYKWGAKPNAATAPDDVAGADCSGYVGYLVTRACRPNRVQWTGRGTFWFAKALRTAGVKRSSVEDGTYRDGVVRIAVALAGRGIGTIGHIAIIFDGKTLECYGSKGVGSRPWTGKGWQKWAVVYAVAQVPEGSLLK